MLMLSRLRLPVTREEPPRPLEEIHFMEYLDASPVTSSQIRLWTDQDPVLAKVKGWVLTGWPEKPPEEMLRAYFHRRREFSVEDGCLLWRSRVVVPAKGEDKLHPCYIKLTREFLAYVGAMFGGRELTRIWNCVSSHVKHVNSIKNLHLLYHYIRGLAQAMVESTY